MAISEAIARKFSCTAISSGLYNRLIKGARTNGIACPIEFPVKRIRKF
jgi:hypothetical protein